MAEEYLTSGFVEEPAFDAASYQGIEEVYVSESGYTRLFRCERFGRLHLLKALKSMYRGSVFYEQALQKEFSIGYTLDHPHICRTVGWEELPQLGHCIVLEYIDGYTWQQALDEGRLTSELAYKWVGELCEALQYLHSKQIIHRDLKPANVLITHNGQHCKLIDFSLSDCDDYEWLKQPAGTRYYLAPEALQCGVALDLRADLYSLGIMVGELATQLQDKHLAAISRRCTQRHRERRYASAQAVLEALRTPPSSRRRVVGWTLLAVAVLLGSVIGWWTLREEGSAISPVAQPVWPAYGNLAGGEACRRILSEARLQLPTDSTALLQRLKEALDAEYPLAVQRQGEAYEQHWRSLQQEVQVLYGAASPGQSPTICRKRPQTGEVR